MTSSLRMTRCMLPGFSSLVFFELPRPLKDFELKGSIPDLMPRSFDHV